MNKGCYLMVAFTRHVIMVEARTASYPVKYATYKEALLACELAKLNLFEVFAEAVRCDTHAEFKARLAKYRIAVR